MKPFSSRLATSCVALLAATGCVSQKQFSQVTSDRDQLSSELSRTRAARDATGQEAQRLAGELATTKGEADSQAKRAADTGAQLTQARGELAALLDKLTTTRGQLKTTDQNLSQAQQAGAQARERLAASEKHALKLKEDLQLARAALADNAASVAGAEHDPLALDLAVATYESLLKESKSSEQKRALKETIATLKKWRI
jgi:chromosome segregation ATPase